MIDRINKENVSELPSKKAKDTKKKNIKREYKDTKVEVKEPIKKSKIKTVKVLLNGRSGPSFDNDVIEMYQAGEKLEIIKDDGVWGKTTRGTYIKLEFVE